MTVSAPAGYSHLANAASLTNAQSVALARTAIHLSPEGLLAYCSARLTSIDTTIKQYFAEQQARNKSMMDASKLLSILNKYSGIGKGDVIAAEENFRKGHVHDANALAKLYRETDDPQLKAQIADAFKAISGREIGAYLDKPYTEGDLHAVIGEGKHFKEEVTSEAWSKRAENVKEVQSGLSKAAEMNMIQLQALVSQRQLAVQLTTQLMQNYNDGLKQIAGNVGR
jgi:hypothetical protein